MASKHDVNKENLRRRAGKKFGAEDVFDVEAHYDPSLTYHENVRGMGLQSEGAPTKRQTQAEQQQLFQSNVEEATGETFSSDLSEEQDFRVLPKAISGKGLEIRINAPILTDQEELKNACTSALSKVAQAMVYDVVQARKDIFADKDGHNTFSEYGSPGSYYSSGMVPFWKGGLLGSFEDFGAIDRMNRNLGFTAAYAGIVEEGGIVSEPPPVEWVTDKMEGQTRIFGGSFRIRPHPFTAAVARKLDEHLEDFGYLDLFGIDFSSSLK